jgi:secondary thiamine-phosphate synthase enzyme
MNWYKETLELKTHGKALYPITTEINAIIKGLGIQEGMCFLYIPHTSASITINESYDPSARTDLEASLEHLVPENEVWYQHRLEGLDDSPAHIRTMLTQTSLTIPIDDGKLTLGTWQGVYFFEHRGYNHRRQVWLRLLEIS